MLFRSDGSVCWGGAATAIIDAISRYDLEMLVQIILSFVHNPNLADVYGKKVNLFPEAD